MTMVSFWSCMPVMTGTLTITNDGDHRLRCLGWCRDQTHWVVEFDMLCFCTVPLLVDMSGLKQMLNIALVYIIFSHFNLKSSTLRWCRSWWFPPMQHLPTNLHGLKPRWREVDLIRSPMWGASLIKCLWNGITSIEIVEPQHDMPLQFSFVKHKNYVLVFSFRLSVGIPQSSQIWRGSFHYHPEMDGWILHRHILWVLKGTRWWPSNMFVGLWTARTIDTVIICT